MQHSPALAPGKGSQASPQPNAPQTRAQETQQGFQVIAFIHSQNILYPDPAPSSSPEKNSTKGTLLPCRVFEQEFEQHLEPNEFPLPVAQGSGAQKQLFPPGGAHGSGRSQDLAMQSSRFQKERAGEEQSCTAAPKASGTGSSQLHTRLRPEKGIKNSPA